jgi:DNA-binding Lrp family transcriptional regulator
MPNKNELTLIQEKEARMKELERDLEQAKEEYHSAIRQMHVAGKSMREIAKLLNLSHQRVHQIIESENKGWRAWLKPIKPDIACSFCGLAAVRVKKLVQGPNIFACDFCITSCSMVLEANCPSYSILSGGNDFKKIDLTSKLRCSFCGKLPSQKRQVIAGKNHQVCDKCVDLALQYMQIDKAGKNEVAKKEPPAPEPSKRIAVVILRLRIERNSKWVRGIKRSIEDIEFFVLPSYLPKRLSDREYELQVSYEDDKDLDDRMYELLGECHRMADSRNCFSESDIHEKGTERYWD